MADLKKVLSLVLAILVGVAASLLFLTYSFRYIPSDLERVGTLLRALDSNKDQVEVVVFGSSITMGGVDTSQFPVPAYNLATTGQTLAEVRLLFQELPQSVNTIFMVLEPMPLEKGRDAFLRQDVYNAYWMSGFRIHEDTERELIDIFPNLAPPVLSMSAFEQIVHSRWNLMQAIDISARGLITEELELERAATDLFYPYTYTKQVSPARMKGAVKRYASMINYPDFKLSSTKEALLRLFAQYARERSIRLFIAVPPANPGVQELVGDDYRVDVVETLTRVMVEEGQYFVDGTQAFYDERYFIDQAHFGHDGAMLFTPLLVDAWREP